MGKKVQTAYLTINYVKILDFIINWIFWWNDSMNEISFNSTIHGISVEKRQMSNSLTEKYYFTHNNWYVFYSSTLYYFPILSRVKKKMYEH